MSEPKDNYNNLRSFFNEEYYSLKAYARSRIDNSTDWDAEDIVQDVALKLFSRANSLSPINNIAGFVYRSLKNKIIDKHRVKKETIAIEKELEEKLIHFTELLYGKTENYYSAQMKKNLKRAILNLKPLYKSIILAIDFEGLSYKEVSLETGIPVGTLMSRRHRAISQLFNELKTKKNIN